MQLTNKVPYLYGDHEDKKGRSNGEGSLLSANFCADVMTHTVIANWPDFVSCSSGQRVF